MVEVLWSPNRFCSFQYSSQWMVAGAGDPQPSPSTFVHGDSPASGNMWESQGVISFDKLKLTNNRSSIVQGQICLHSMHKYIPRIHIQPLSADQIKSGKVLIDIGRKSKWNEDGMNEWNWMKWNEWNEDGKMKMIWVRLVKYFWWLFRFYHGIPDGYRPICVFHFPWNCFYHGDCLSESTGKLTCFSFDCLTNQMVGHLLFHCHLLENLWSSLLQWRTIYSFKLSCWISKTIFQHLNALYWAKYLLGKQEMIIKIARRIHTVSF